MTEKQALERKTTAAEAHPYGNAAAQAPQTEAIYLPEVDVGEDNEHFRLLADMPGVERQAVEMTVENGVLTIEGPALVERPQGYTLVGQEFGVGRYRRDFTLPDAVDSEHIKAKLRHGVLEVLIPKRTEAQIRKIKIEA